MLFIFYYSKSAEVHLYRTLVFGRINVLGREEKSECNDKMLHILLRYHF